MIVGLGTDIVDIRRIANLSFGRKNFLAKYYTDNELNYIQTKKEHDSFYAMYFAAKEACSKALGTGFSNGVSAKNIEIIHCLHTGQPSVILHNTTKAYLMNLINPSLDFIIHISLTDEHPIAYATIIIEKM